jgi:integrase
MSLYGYEQRLARCQRSIKQLRNGETSLRFLTHLGALGLSIGRVTKYAAHLPVLLRAMDFDLKDIRREDAERVVVYINSQPHRETTKRDKKLLLRKLVQFAKNGTCDRDTPLPDEVKWIKLRVKENDPRATPESLLTPREFAAIVKATENTRDRAMIYVTFEAALRPGELLTMTVNSVEFKDGYCLIAVNGKTGIKRIPLVVAYKPLLEWLANHPQRDDPNAPLWCSLASNYKGGQLSYVHFRLIIKKLAKRAGIKKDVWPYLYRHTTLTAMAKVFTEARLEQFAGWTHGSKMTSRYVHFSARDLEGPMLELHGLKPAEKSDGLPTLVECSRCGNKNPFGNVRCGFCGMILDREAAEKMELEEQRGTEEMQKKNEELQTRLEKLETVISSLLASQGEANNVH